MTMKKSLLILMCTPLIWGCTSTLTALRSPNNDAVFEEMRMEIADLKHTLHGTEVEVKLLEERLDGREENPGKGDLAAVQRKIAALEKTVDKMSSDLKSLMNYASQTTSSLSQYRDRIQELDRKLEEVTQLKSTLSQISKTYSSSEIYQVQSGDSLEKIARKFHVSLESLKRENNLSSDKIVVGQQLNIPHE